MTKGHYVILNTRYVIPCLTRDLSVTMLVKALDSSPFGLRMTNVHHVILNDDNVILNLFQDLIKKNKEIPALGPE